MNSKYGTHFQELSREKTRAALVSYIKKKPILKKSKLPLLDLIVTEYPGEAYNSFLIPDICF